MVQVKPLFAEARDLVGKAHRIFLAKLGADQAHTRLAADDLKRINDALGNSPVMPFFTPTG